ncbi:MAG: hypothetical protein JOY60_11080 [Burkholderiaceae bacterium]|nr:hypothetical protein [Roseateles sp.]MBV8470386.1 hypothetical protein [Burkholderiaceae bacterium]
MVQLHVRGFLQPSQLGVRRAELLPEGGNLGIFVYVTLGLVSRLGC